MKTYKKILSITGGSTKGAGLYGIALGIMETWKPDLIVGMSVSSIFAIPLAMNIDVSNNLIYSSNKEIFGRFKPVGKKGNISFRGLFRVLLGKSMGKQDELKETIRSIITPNIFYEYKNKCEKNEVPKIDIVYVNYNKATIETSRLHKLEYEEMLNNIMASSNMPLYTNSVIVNNDICYDGGIMVANYAYNYIDSEEIRCIWARPDIETDRKNIYTKLKDKFIPTLFRTIELQNKSISYQNESMINLLCEKNNIKIRHYHLNSGLESFYDTDVIERKLDYENGLILGRT